ncbi:hypothetical protein FACS1894202_09780 [Clostridia bacterium]|nr:hypothetical protein FACS1894202_09780 [Clostridia bacterium]
MMTIDIGDKQYELKTTLGVTQKLEKTSGKPLGDILVNIQNATVDEHLKILSCGTEDSQALKADALDNMDYSTLSETVMEFLARLQFGGSPEQIEKKLADSPLEEAQKNYFRGLLKLPTVSVSGNGS